jgi:hypothetical protein
VRHQTLTGPRYCIIWGPKTTSQRSNLSALCSSDAGAVVISPLHSKPPIGQPGGVVGEIACLQQLLTAKPGKGRDFVQFRDQFLASYCFQMAARSG